MAYLTPLEIGIAVLALIAAALFVDRLSRAHGQKLARMTAAEREEHDRDAAI